MTKLSDLKEAYFGLAVANKGYSGKDILPRTPERVKRTYECIAASERCAMVLRIGGVDNDVPNQHLLELADATEADGISLS